MPYKGCNFMFRLLAVLFLTISQCAYSGVQIDGTRVIYNEKSNQVDLGINNSDDHPYLIQAWASKDINGHQVDQTFIMTPPLFRLEPKSTNSVHIVYTGKELPKDRESLFWMNIKSIPATDPNAKNKLTINVKSVIKLLFRPEGLSGNSFDSEGQITFEHELGKVFAINNSPYYITLSELSIDNKNVNDPPMIPPKSKIVIPGSFISVQNIKWKAINDLGGISKEFHQGS